MRQEHTIKTDLRYGTIVSSGRKSITILCERPGDPVFRVKRVTRSPYEQMVKSGLTSRSSLPLPISIFNSIEKGNTEFTHNLASFPLQNKLQKITVREHQKLFYLTALDERAHDSYFLRTTDWEDVERAVGDLTSGAIAKLPLSCLSFYNPLGILNPLDKTTPPVSDFENLMKEKAADLVEVAKKMQEVGVGIFTDKVVASLLKCAAEVERASTFGLLPYTPLPDDFESEDFE